MPKKNTHRPSTRHATCSRCGKVLVGFTGSGHAKTCPDCTRIIKQEKLKEKAVG